MQISAHRLAVPCFPLVLVLFPCCLNGVCGLKGLSWGFVDFCVLAEEKGGGSGGGCVREQGSRFQGFGEHLHRWRQGIQAAPYWCWVRDRWIRGPLSLEPRVKMEELEHTCPHPRTVRQELGLFVCLWVWWNRMLPFYSHGFESTAEKWCVLCCNVMGALSAWYYHQHPLTTPLIATCASQMFNSSLPLTLQSDLLFVFLLFTLMSDAFLFISFLEPWSLIYLSPDSFWVNQCSLKPTIKSVTFPSHYL